MIVKTTATRLAILVALGESTWEKSDIECPDAKKKDVERAINIVIDKYRNGLTTGCKSNKCQCVPIKGAKPTPWTEWAEVKVSTSYRKGRCVYTVKANVKLRTRATDGFCLPKMLELAFDLKEPAKTE
jgi:hypothetical protein